MSLTATLNEQPLTMPTEQLELNVIEYCMNVLGLPFGEFWYEWFPSNKIDNYALHITCNVNGLRGKVKATINQIKGIEVVKIFEVMELDISRWVEPGEPTIKYRAHIKAIIDL